MEKGKSRPNVVFDRWIEGLSFPSKNLTAAYTFWIAAFLFGLPLLSSFYLVQFSEYSLIKYLVPYCLFSIIVGIVLLNRRGGLFRPDR